MKKIILPVIVILFSCQEPEKEITVVPSPATDTLMNKKDSVATESPVQLYDSTVSCKDYGGNMEDGYTEVCDFIGKTIHATYSYYLTTKSENAKYLEKNIPLQDTSVKQTDVSVDYKWESKSKLITNLHFAGGETTITFEEKNNKTQVTFYSSPD